MATISVIGAFGGASASYLTGITDLFLREGPEGARLYTVTRGGGVLALNVDTGWVRIGQSAGQAGASLPAPARLALFDMGGSPFLARLGDEAALVTGFRLTPSGGLGADAEITGSAGGRLTAMAEVTLGGTGYLYTSRMGEQTILAYRLAANGRATEVDAFDHWGELQGVDITDLVTVAADDGPRLLALSATGDALRSFRLGPGGEMTLTTTLGAGGGLGISTPSDIEVTAAFGATWVVVAAAGSSSISVIEMRPGGRLLLRDHIVDSLDTRFQGVQAVEVVEAGGRVFLFAGGGDEGLNMFTLMPDGRLLWLAEVLTTAAMRLDNITAIEGRLQGGLIDLFVATETRGLIRLQADPGTLGQTIQRGASADSVEGGAAGDMIWGGGGNDTLKGGGGQDILIDGAGSDAMTGGEGADIFVLTGDGVADSILDFDPDQDRIDLTGWGRLFSADDIRYRARSNGAILTWGSERLTILSADGETLPQAVFSSSALFGLWHVLAPAPAEGLRLEGSGGNSTLTGGAGEDTLVGSAAIDVMEGGAGFDVADYGAATAAVTVDLTTPAANRGIAQGDRHSGIEGVIGGAGGDDLRGTGGANMLRGGAGGDTLAGRGGGDSLYGGAGDDWLAGGAGADLLSGGAGFDIADYGDATTGVTVDLEDPFRSTGDAAGDRFAGIEGIAGSRFADRLRGDAGGNDLRGGAGHDALNGRGGNDRLSGDAGDDTLRGEAGDDTLSGGAGFDLADFSGTAAVTVSLAISGPQTTGQGRDVLTGIESLLGGRGADRLTGNSAANRLTGGDGADTLAGAGGADTLAGGAGNDVIDGGSGFDWLILGSPARGGLRLSLATTGWQATGEGSDRVTGIEAVVGGRGNDTLTGSAQANILKGGDGHDVISGGGGSDTLDGGGGSDTLLLAPGLSARNAIAADLQSATIRTHWGPLRQTGFENLTSAAGNDTLMGNAAANRLEGAAGNDRLDGRGGHDHLIGGSGKDRLIGGAGNDRLTGDSGSDWADYSGSVAVTVSLASSGWQATGQGTDILSGIENLQGGRAGDRLAGSGAANTLIGDAGGDRLDGLAGDDRLYGGAGADTLVGGAGRDLLAGGSGVDLAIFAGRGAVTVNLARGGYQATGQGRDKLVGIEQVLAGGGRDRLTGSNGDNALWGGGGNDRLSGRGGRDLLDGGAGRDRLDGGAGRDWLTGGAGNDQLRGRAGDDRLDGSHGRDRLEGGAGRDRLDGGRGHDVLTGGGGGDTFVFGDGRDVIRDFGRGDRILIMDHGLPASDYMSGARVIERYGRDLGDSVMLDFGRGDRLILEDVADFRGLADRIDVI